MRSENGEKADRRCGISTVRSAFIRCARRLTVKTLIARSIPLAALLLAAPVHGDSPAPRHRGQTRYQVTNLASLGGTSSDANSINDRGWVAGRSNVAGNQSRHAVLWRHGSLVDLGTLGGPNSAVLWPVKNVRGIVTGIAQTDEPDPLGENWSCAAFFPAATGTGFRCLGFKWEAGVMTPLPTLGGTHGFATGSNNRGEVVGWAENTVRDTTCEAPQILQFRAVVWGPRAGQIRELPPYGDDTVSAATAINDRGQVVGISGICDQAVGRFSAIHAVLWERGRVIDLGNLGGTAWVTPMSINQRGDVVGFSNVSEEDGGDFVPRAFLWTRHGGIRDLGTLPGHVTSQALGINEWRQVVGQSCDADDNCLAFLWEDGAMIDLNRRAPGNDDLLISANDIDDFGRIVGQADDDEAVAIVGFVARPAR
jgi:probable HAF family extracellular repeat protein